MDEKSFVILAISTFEETAFQVIESMAKHFKLDLSSSNPFSKLQSRRNDLWKGQFDHWHYRFHGDSCEFIHEQSNQFLDVKINREKNYGAINHYFLFRFIETTNNLNHLNTEIDALRLYEILDQLKEEGRIVNVGDLVFPTWILAKSAPE